MNHGVPTPLRWAFSLVSAAALLIIILGTLRPAGPETAVAVVDTAIPPLTLTGPRLRALQAVALATPLPSATPTSTPVPLPTPTVTPLPTPTATATTVPASYQLTGLRHFWQTWNNCGPATLAMNLSYYGAPLDQAVIGEVLRRHPDDKNVSPEELAAYARSQGYLAQVRVDGSAELLRALLARDTPVLIETWLEEKPNDGLGHYRLIVGFDDLAARWTAYDSYVHTNLVSTDPASYQGIYLDYAQTDALWAVFNRTYVLVYPPEHAATVDAILGAASDPLVMWQESLATAQAAVAANPVDPFAHFNLGSSLVALGDYAGAAAAYDEARRIGLPWRMLWYQFGPFVAYHAVGRYADVVQLADATLATTTSIEELHYWRGQGLAGLGDPNAARAAYEQALALNPDFPPARAALP
jgi:tetratricopeptide (TPR) repeat protein